MKRHNYDDGDGQSETQGGYDDGDGQSETQGDCDDANPSCAPRVAVSWTTTEVSLFGWACPKQLQRSTLTVQQRCR